MNVGSGLIEPDEAFAQVLDGSGARRPVERDRRQGRRCCRPTVALSLRAPTFFDRRLPGIDNVTRLLAVPVQTPSGRAVVVVGSSLQDRADQLLQLGVTLAIVTPIAVILICDRRMVARGRRAPSGGTDAARGGGDLLVGPREPPDAPAGGRRDPARLGATMNAMLDRIQGSVERERAFVDDASHELRTPLSILKAELDLALARPRTPEELTAALRSASVETDHLVRLAEDLLVLARSHDGRLPVRGSRRPICGTLLETVVARHRTGARSGGCGAVGRCARPWRSAWTSPGSVKRSDDLLDNALRHVAARRARPA